MTLLSLRRGAPAATALLLAAFATTGAARADRAAGDACAAALSADGKAIYAGAVGPVSSGADVRGTVTDTAKSLVMSGTIGRGSARANAEAAGACLQQARS